MLMRLRAIPRALVELAEATVAVGDEVTRAELGAERQALAVVPFGILGAARGRDITGEAEGVGLAGPSSQPAGERQGLFSVASGLADPPGPEAGHPRV